VRQKWVCAKVGVRHGARKIGFNTQNQPEPVIKVASLRVWHVFGVVRSGRQACIWQPPIPGAHRCFLAQIHKWCAICACKLGVRKCGARKFPQLFYKRDAGIPTGRVLEHRHEANIACLIQHGQVVGASDNKGRFPPNTTTATLLGVE